MDITRHFTMGITVQVLGVMEFHERQIEPPSSWEEFEELCLTLFRRIWKDPTAQKNGRRGQPQAGTDISGYDAGDHGSPRGVQCKGKDRLYGAAVTAAELREEVEKAKAFKPKLSHWVLATTARKDNAIEELARIITEDHRASGHFRVQVLGWEDLRSLIAEYPEVMEKHYRDQAPTARRTLGLIEDLKTSSELRGELHGAALQLIGSKLDVLIGRGATPA